MRSLFHYCRNLQFLNLSNFNTSSVKYMDNMFNGCESLTSLDLSSFNTSSIDSMDDMFNGAKSLISLDLSNFNTSLVESMSYMSNECELLKILNLKNFDTSKVTNTKNMFSLCISLTSLDLSSFNMSSVNEMSYMFYKCSSLLSLNLSNFNTPSLIKMNYVFSSCSSLRYLNNDNFNTSIVEKMSNLFSYLSSLTSINLSHFVTSRVNNMNEMFSGCSSLISLNINNFDTRLVYNMEYMFSECISLVSLNINFNTTFVYNMDYMFYKCISLVSLNILSFDTKRVQTMKYMLSDCYSLVSLNLGNFDTSLVTDMQYMFYQCYKLKSLNLSSFNNSAVENMNLMFFKCKSIEYINLFNFKDDISTQALSMFFGIPENIVYCISDEEKAPKIMRQLLDKKCNINDCSNNWKSKQLKLTNENNQCIENSCINDEIYRYEYENICYRKCPIGTSPSKKNQFLCEKLQIICPENAPYENVASNLCEKVCDAKDFFEEKCKISNKKIKILIDKISEIENEIINYQSLLKTVINYKTDLFVNSENIKYQITTINNEINEQYNNNNKSISIIKFGQCERILKDIYNITYDIELIIFKIEYTLEGLLIPLIFYDIFDPISKTKLNLNYCNNTKLNIEIPISIDENELYKYDPNSEYYKDKCKSYLNNKSVDITLYDRKNDYNINNMSLCEENCEFKSYNSKTKKVLCICEIKNKSPLTLEDIIKKDKLLNNFININSISNLDIMKCYKVLFSKSGLIKNIGSYILLLIILIFLVSSILFYLTGYNEINNKIQNIISSRKENEINNSNSRNKRYLDNKKNKKGKFKRNKKYFPLKSIKKKHCKDKINSKSSSKINIIKKNDLIINKIDKIDNTVKYVDYELNNFSYKEAKKKDKRTFFQYYISLIIKSNILLLAFYPKDDYNSKIIKICLFFFSFALYYAVNTLFFNDLTMHKIYEDEGVFNFIYLIPQILYSIIISTIINIIIKYLSLSEKDITNLKKAKIKDRNPYKVKRCLIIKFICFYVIGILFLGLFWYYVSCFCAVFKNTQIYLIKEILISFSLSLLYPFILCLFPAMFRIISLNKPEELLFKINKLIQ